MTNYMKPRYLTTDQKAEFRSRLRKAYSLFRKNLNAVARQNYLCCSSCAGSALGEQARIQNKKPVIFSHKQDAGSLSLGYMSVRYGNLDGNDIEDQELGRQIVQILRQVGLSVDWNGSPNQVIKAQYIP